MLGRIREIIKDIALCCLGGRGHIYVVVGGQCEGG